MARLRPCHHIIKVQEFGIEVNKYGVDGSTPFLVMEHASLGTLRTLHPHGTKVPLKKIALYVKQVADALQYAHDFDPVVVHRDVKPENMLIRKPDEVVLSDFGIAVAGLNTGNLGQQIQQIQQIAMQQGDLTVAGTAAYIAPERLQGHTQRASDQYSLADRRLRVAYRVSSL